MNAATQRGFGLIEILITLVVIAFGIMAHLTFQRVTFHEAGLAVGRAKAAEVAQEKLEDLTAFGCLKTGDCAFAFQDIATDAGGNPVSGGSQLELPAATAFLVDNSSYTRHWTVTNYWYTAINSAPATTAPAGAPLPSLKAVTVSITWTDTNGDDQSLSLSTLIAGADPAAAARAFQ
jgi:prepilin-type N-terminal cleavage/methylation domain-containing protein